MNTTADFPAAAACQAEVLPIPTLRGKRQPIDRIHATLLRRIDTCAALRTEAALAPIPELDAWKRQRDRGDKLRRILIAHLVTRIQTTLSKP